MMFSFLYPVISAVSYGFMNVLDKYIIAHRVRRPLGYTAIVGLVNLLLGLVFSLFLDWSHIGVADLIVPTIVGLLFAGNLYFYCIMLKTEDISYLIGFMYLYPIIVAVLSFLFLNERLSLLGYAGALCAIIGVVLLSVRVKKVRLQVSIWFLFIITCVTGINEFLIKVATNNLSPWNGVAVSFSVFGAGVLIGLLHPTVRKDAIKELHTFGWAAGAQVFDLIGQFFLYLSMAVLPATIAASTTSLQPLAVLLFEWLAEKHIGNMVKDKEFLQKTGATCLIVLGVVLMYL